nr:hypothetical protein [uncultured Flavobacterium sp.]
MKLNYKNFEIELSYNICKESNSNNDLIQYKKIYLSNSNSEDTTKHVIIIKESGIKISNAKIYGVGSFSGIFLNSFILEHDKILMLGGNKVYCLDIPFLELLWYKEFDLHSNFSIYKLEEDFIIHGESQIFRISKEGEIVWSFAGRDIWFNMEGEPELTIETNTIRLFDFVSNEYVLDFNGNLIEDNSRIIAPVTKKKLWNIWLKPEINEVFFFGEKKQNYLTVLILY